MCPVVRISLIELSALSLVAADGSSPRKTCTAPDEVFGDLVYYDWETMQLQWYNLSADEGL